MKQLQLLKKSKLATTISIIAAISGFVHIFIWMQGALTFNGFLAEESIQTLEFGNFPNISNRFWPEAKAYQQEIKPQVESCITYIRKTSRFNIISGKALRIYAGAAERKLAATEKAIQTALDRDRYNIVKHGGYYTGIPILDASNPDEMVVYVSKNDTGKCYHPGYSPLVSRYEMKSIRLREAQKRGLYPASTWERG